MGNVKPIREKVLEIPVQCCVQSVQRPSPFLASSERCCPDHGRYACVSSLRRVNSQSSTFSVETVLVTVLVQ
jgi:hypothetical protein